MQKLTRQCWSSQEFAIYNTGEQNQDMTKERKVRDWKDTLTVLQYLQERNPFSTDPSLRSIATGVNAHSTVTVDTALAVGNAILGKHLLSTPSLGKTKL